MSTLKTPHSRTRLGVVQMRCGAARQMRHDVLVSADHDRPQKRRLRTGYRLSVNHKLHANQPFPNWMIFIPLMYTHHYVWQDGYTGPYLKRFQGAGEMCMDGSRFDDLARALGHGISRRKLLRGLAGGVAGALAGGALTRKDASARSLTICHATGNPNAPYESLTIQQAEFSLHARHGDYLRVECCADGDCPNQYGECGHGVCQNGYCAQLPAEAGTPCDDGLACSANAVCDGAFTCLGTSVVCAETENPCTTSVCSESGGGCQEVPIADQTSCGTGDACTDYVCASGNCLAVPSTACTGNCAVCGSACVDLDADPNNCQSCGHICDGGSDCTIATCNDGICGTAPANEGMTCGTGDACHDLICSSGSCVHVPSTACTGNCHVCGDACVDLDTDPSHCQTCGNVCITESRCMAPACNLGICGTTPTNEGGVCVATSGGVADIGFCTDGECINTCPLGDTCRFDLDWVEDVTGYCVGGGCVCRPTGMPCNCFDLYDFFGCCSLGCSCSNGSRTGTCW